MKNTLKVVFAIVMSIGLGSVSVAQESINALRDAPLNVVPSAPLMTKMVNTDIREIRGFPEQPPIIPHNIRGYQIDLNSNKCMTCHSRTAIGQSQAPMVSVTHFMDREGQVLSNVSPRRYFCTQCHVPQHITKPPVQNDFVDAEQLHKE